MHSRPPATPVTALHGAIDGVLADDGQLDDGELCAAVVDLYEAEARLAAARVRLTAELDRRQAYAPTGAQSTAAFLARECRLPAGLTRHHVRTARAKGLAERRVLIWHVARNAMIPFVTVMIPEIPNIMTGSIFIEQIFRIPGLGRFFVTSTLTRDYPMILALVLLVAVVWGITYLLTDILYTLLDPRFRLR